jgi:hypothetical protein
MLQFTRHTRNIRQAVSALSRVDQQHALTSIRDRRR